MTAALGSSQPPAASSGHAAGCHANGSGLSFPEIIRTFFGDRHPMARHNANPRANRFAPQRWGGGRRFVDRVVAIASLCWFAVVSVGVPQHLGLSGIPLSGAQSSHVCRCDLKTRQAGQCCCAAPAIFASNAASNAESNAAAATVASSLSAPQRGCCSVRNTVASLERATCLHGSSPRTGSPQRADLPASSQPASSQPASTVQARNLAPSGRPAASAGSRKAACCSKELAPRSGDSSPAANVRSVVAGGALPSRHSSLPVAPSSEGGRRQMVAIDGCGCGDGGGLPGLIQNQDPRVLCGPWALASAWPCVGWLECPPEVSVSLFALPPGPPPRLDV